MKKPKLPKNAKSDKPAQREARFAYILYLITDGATVRNACISAGVTTKSLYLWVNKDPDMLARYEEAQLDLHKQVEDIAVRCALKALHDPKYQISMMFFLKCRAGWNDGSGLPIGAKPAEMPSIRFAAPIPKKTKTSLADTEDKVTS